MSKITSVSFLDVFEDSFLAKVYSAFEKHINAEPMTRDFFEVVKEEVLIGLPWENTQKILNNLGVKLSHEEVCIFLESHAYLVWFPKNRIAGREFNTLEKTAFAAWTFWTESEEDEQDLWEYTNETRGFLSPPFVEFVFENGVESHVLSFRSFMKTNGVTV